MHSMDGRGIRHNTMYIIQHSFSVCYKSAQRQGGEQVFQLCTLPKPLAEGGLGTHGLVQPVVHAFRPQNTQQSVGIQWQQQQQHTIKPDRSATHLNAMR